MKKIVLMFGGVLSMIVLMSAMKSVAVNVDLSSKGIPVVVDSPNGSVVRAGVLNGMEMEGVMTHCWEINQGDFSLEVSMEDVDLHQARKEYVQFSRNVLEMDQSFVGYVESNEDGFLAKMNFGGIVEYEFYHIVVKNNRAIEFSTGISTSDFSVNNIRKIYNAAKTAK